MLKTVKSLLCFLVPLIIITIFIAFNISKITSSIPKFISSSQYFKKNIKEIFLKESFFSTYKFHCIFGGILIIVFSAFKTFLSSNDKTNKLNNKPLFNLAYYFSSITIFFALFLAIKFTTQPKTSEIINFLTSSIKAIKTIEISVLLFLAFLFSMFAWIIVTIIQQIVKLKTKGQEI